MSEATRHWQQSFSIPRRQQRALKTRLQQEAEELREKFKTMKRQTEERHPDWFDAES